MVLGGILSRLSPGLFGLGLLLTTTVAVVIFIKGPLPRLGLHSRKSGFVALGTAMLLVFGAGAANAEPAPPSNVTALDSSPRGFISSDRATTSPAPVTPSPKPTTQENIEVENTIPFERTVIEDERLEQGKTKVVTSGVAGVSVTTYRITYVDGVEVSREVVEEAITLEPIAEVTAHGTYVPPKPPATNNQQPATKESQTQESSASEECHPNYTGACVPIASDVDCAGGSGDGPAYVKGPVYVVGKDVYKLDRDGDGIACEK